MPTDITSMCSNSTVQVTSTHGQQKCEGDRPPHTNILLVLINDGWWVDVLSYKWDPEQLSCILYCTILFVALYLMVHTLT